MIGRTAFIGFFLCAAVGPAQQYKAAAHPHSPCGKVFMLVEPIQGPSSLGQLIKPSTVIVDGTVVSTRAISTSEDPDVSSIETHSVVGVNAVVSGTVPHSSANILLVQTGGKLGCWDVTAEGDALVEPGERYILFLMPDERKELPNTSGLPRYAVIGVWSGKAKVVDGKVEFARKADPPLHKYDHTGVTAFIKAVKEAIENPPMPKPRPPLFPVPPQRP